MKISEIRKLSIKELQAKLDDYKKELFNLRFQKAINQLENVMRIRTVKKTIARILTIINEKSRELQAKA